MSDSKPAGDHPRTHRHAPSLSFQAISFAAIGASGTVITFILLTVLHKGFGWEISIANIPAYGAGIINNYTWNRVWTFRHVQHRNVLHQGGAFALVSLGGLLINTIVLSFLVHRGVNYLISFAVAAVVAYGWNFGVNHQFTFRHKKATVALNAGD
jgi:dolichol-phosphate mannosyltransferase